VIALLATAAAATENILYNFAGDEDGEYADTGVVLDSAGNIYGVTIEGGAHSSGTVWRITASGEHTVLYNFGGGADGSEPYKGVTLDAAGNLYGTTVAGGDNACDGGCGVVYKLTKSGGTWKQTVLHAFTGGADGSGAGSPLILDKHGNIYGMTPAGGVSGGCFGMGCGVVFRLAPDGTGKYSFRVLHTFTGDTDGFGGSAGRLLLRHGRIFGVATQGGANGWGVAFEMTPTPTGEWKFQTIYAFGGMPDAGSPYGGLIADKSGNLYGTTYFGGTNGFGSVYRLERNGTSWTEAVLYSFQGGADGDSPLSTLAFDGAGNLFGTTSLDGDPDCACGTIFELSPASGGWTETVVHVFTGASGDGAFPYPGVVRAPSGTFYGAARNGGSNDDGAIFTVTP
jgi:uncharacterized repeat protein (TIGR03803 family)